MGKHLAIIILTTLSIFSNAQIRTDSTKLNLYCFSEIPFVYAKTLPTLDKWSDVDAYIIQSTNYKFKTPAFGVGFFYKGKRIFLRTECSFWYGLKEANFSHYFNDWSGPPPQFADGTSTRETFSGTVNYYNVDCNTSIGYRIGKRSTLFYGIKRNFLVNYSFNGDFTREFATYRYYAWGMPADLLDHGIEKENGKNVSVSRQVMSGFLFHTLGYSFQFVTKNSRGFIIEALALFPIPLFYGDYGPWSFNLKFGYKLGKSK